MSEWKRLPPASAPNSSFQTCVCLRSPNPAFDQARNLDRLPARNPVELFTSPHGWYTTGLFPSRRRDLAEGDVILLIEDDPAVLEAAQELLNHQRRVFFASDTRHALELAQDLGFSVVLVDLDLKRGDGLLLIRQNA